MKTAQTITLYIFQREKLVILLIGLSLALSTFYVMLISQTVLNAVDEIQAQNSIREIEKNIAELELAFIENENVLNMDYAYALGFKDVEKRHFVTRTASLTLR
jgi:hypothetical protein